MVLAFPFSGGQANSRTYLVPASEGLQPTNIAVIPAGAAFQIRQRDVLDFTVDYSAFLTGIGSDAALASVNFAIVSATTQSGASAPSPAIQGNAFDPAGKAVFVLKPNVAAAVGDIYLVDVAATTSQTSLGSGTQVPARTITRRVAITVVAG